MLTDHEAHLNKPQTFAISWLHSKQAHTRAVVCFNLAEAVTVHWAVDIWLFAESNTTFTELLQRI